MDFLFLLFININPVFKQNLFELQVINRNQFESLSSSKLHMHMKIIFLKRKNSVQNLMLFEQKIISRRKRHNTQAPINWTIGASMEWMKHAPTKSSAYRNRRALTDPVIVVESVTLQSFINWCCIAVAAAAAASPHYAVASPQAMRLT